MAAYLHFQINGLTKEDADIAMALLIQAGFEGFEETTDGLNAFIAQQDWTAEKENWMTGFFPYAYSKTEIKETNWNALWESNFSPVVVNDFVTIRAHFHVPADQTRHEIIITPKMSFGTGHHATTYMMMDAMSAIDFTGKRVLDFGTGTGVLAILAEKLGSEYIVAIDNDNWSIENAGENAAMNDCHHIRLVLAGEADVQEPFDIILANINRNVLLDNMSLLKKQLAAGGTILLSGLLVEDLDVMQACIADNGLEVIHQADRSNWLLLRVSHIA